MYRLDSLSVTGSLGSVLPTRRYDYDPAGNIHAITSELPGGDEPHIHEYDLMDRMSSWTTPAHLQEFTYDANGNRQSQENDGQYTSYGYHANARNLLASSTGAENRTYVVDQVGNIAGWDARSLVYDLNNRLDRVEENNALLGEYVYNMDGQRIKKTAAGLTTYFEYDARGHLIHEYRPTSGVVVDYVYIDDEPLAMLVSDNMAAGGTVVPLSGANGSLSPSTAQVVGYGAQVTFTVTPNLECHLESVSGCGGTLSGTTFTTAPMTGDCTVTAAFGVNTYTVTPTTDENGGLIPGTPQAVPFGGTATFTVQPGIGYHVASIAGCGGSLSGTTFTTAPIIGGCTVAATFARDTYVVTPTAGEGGSLAPSTPQSASYGETVAFTVQPSTGYHVASVTGCGGSQNGTTYTTAPLSGACTVTATFGINAYTITPTAGDNGSLTPSSPQSVTYGETVAFTVQSDTNYHVASISGCGGALDGSIYTTAPLTGDCAVLATFAINTHTVTPVAGANGSLDPSTPQTVEHGQQILFTALPNPHYQVASIAGCNGTYYDWDAQFWTDPITSDCTVSATFEPESYWVSGVASTGGWLAPMDTRLIPYGSTQVFTIYTDYGYHFVSITGCYGTLVDANHYSTGPIAADCNVYATFARDVYTVTPIAGANGTLSPATPQSVAYNLTTAFAVQPNNGYRVASASGCGGHLTGNTYTTGPISANCTVNATFEPSSYSLNLSKSGAGSGTVSSSPAGISCGSTCSATYSPGTVVNLTQTPAAGSVFSGWGGACSGTGGCTVTMNGNQTVTAVFAQGIVVTTPNGGETWLRNSTYAIQWTYRGSPGTKVKIELLKAGVVVKTITSNASVGSGGNGSYSWKVPSNQATGADHQIRVTSTTASGYSDTSNANFTIN